MSISQSSNIVEKCTKYYLFIGYFLIGVFRGLILTLLNDPRLIFISYFRKQY